jgi:hypothetical protein
LEIRGITTKKKPRIIADLTKGNAPRFCGGMCSFSVRIIAQKFPLISVVMLRIRVMPAV